MELCEAPKVEAEEEVADVAVEEEKKKSKGKKGAN